MGLVAERHGSSASGAGDASDDIDEPTAIPALQTSSVLSGGIAVTPVRSASPKLTRTMSFATAQAALEGEAPATLSAPLRAAMDACIDKYSAVTVNDILEMRSFANPPPAVALVSCALTLLLTGEAMEWRDARRQLSNGDKLLSTMSTVRPEALNKKRLASLSLLVDNPAFASEYLRPVSNAACKVAEWITAVARLAALHKAEGKHAPTASASKDVATYATAGLVMLLCLLLL